MPLGQRQVLDPVLRVVRVGLDDERVGAAAEIGRVVEEVVGPAAEVRHGDVRGHARAGSRPRAGPRPSPSTAGAGSVLSGALKAGPS